MSDDDENILHIAGSHPQRKRINAIESGDEQESQVNKKSKESREEFIEIIGTEGTPDKLNFSELELRSLSKKSNKDVWSHFGHLYKNEKMVTLFQKKIACKHCFEKRIWKW